jgi:hypothetical protein
VKTNTVYETVRLLGRGAFGDVNLGTIHTYHAYDY